MASFRKISMNKSSTSVAAAREALDLIVKDLWLSTSRLFNCLTAWSRSCDDGLWRRVFIISALAFVTTQASATGPNILVNGGFEDNPPPAGLGNHLGHDIKPWVITVDLNGQQPNVVTVDGTTFSGAIAGNYGNDGPHFDASGSPLNVVRHYLDIDRGENDFYQSFTPQCNGQVTFGGFFSTRALGEGKGSVKIVQGVGTGTNPTLPVVGATNEITLLPGDSTTWTPVSFTVSVYANTTYSFVVSMDNFMNFDEGFVRYETECNPTSPTPTPTPTESGCVQVTEKGIRCEPDGSYSYSFSVANGTGNDVPQILLSPVAGSSFALSQQLFNLSSPLQNGQSGTLSVKIGKVKPGSKVCFFVTLMSKKASCCTVKVCPALPTCGDRRPASTGR